MLYLIGALKLDTRPFSVDEVQRTMSADFADKPIVGGMIAREFMGEGSDKLILSGQLLPFKTGGLTELELVKSMMLAGLSQPVQRGDGTRVGWFTIDKVSEGHKELMRDGVGFFIRHSIELTKSSPERSSTSVINSILSLFGLME
ncbi:phage tail protein [Rhizobium sp. LC145]|uniref:phage tail protein n=1 Tax=Rhizobium sp. LC145 TaxID=1120688 RepID=UPI00062A1274|nr:phage tail protein [Rhizobium sp. LC145]KKX24304.1 tail protein [Rhizobium sp. LC145]TKT46173.1 phage tail protein [Rhizobiaceae bacterium LC148]